LAIGPNFACFAGVKLAGYTAAAWALKRSYEKPEISVAKVGFIRTGIGIAAGIAYGGIWLLFPLQQIENLKPNPAFYFLLGLSVVRLCEWSFILWFFFDRTMTDRPTFYKWAVYGSLWSYVLDAIGIASGFVVPGGFWIC
jgi:hypothetical protein